MVDMVSLSRSLISWRKRGWDPQPRGLAQEKSARPSRGARETLRVVAGQGARTERDPGRPQQREDGQECSLVQWRGSTTIRGACGVARRRGGWGFLPRATSLG